MRKYWEELIRLARIELEYLDDLKANLVHEQSLIVFNKPTMLKGVLEEQQAIMKKNFQIDQYRMKIMEKLAENSQIPSRDISVTQLFESMPKEYQKDFRKVISKMKAVAFEIQETNLRNQMLLNRSIDMIDEEIRLFTMGGQDKGLYHRNGEYVEKQQLSILNRKG